MTPDDNLDELLMMVVCDKMHWTYQEYMSQPVEFIMLLTTKWRLDNEHEEKVHKKKRENGV